MAVAAFPSCGARRLNARPWLHAVRSSTSSPSPPRSPTDVDGLGTAPTSAAAASRSFFPKRGQTLELVCESLAFKGKGVCKVVDTGFVLMCDRVLPGERFLGRVSRKKGNYAEVRLSSTSLPLLPSIVSILIGSCHKIIGNKAEDHHSALGLGGSSMRIRRGLRRVQDPEPCVRGAAQSQGTAGP